MTHFGIAKTFDGKFDFIEGTKEEIIKKMNDLSNKGSDKYSTIRIFPYSAYQTKRSFKKTEPKKATKKTSK